MKQEQLKSHAGYLIPCTNQILDGKKNLIVLHGFGSSKGSPMIQTLRNVMPKLSMELERIASISPPTEKVPLMENF